MSDLDFRAWAVQGNAFHGRRMTPEETRVQVALLAQGGMPQREIAKKTGVSQSTVSRMLRGGDSNRQAEVIHTNQPSASGSDSHESARRSALDDVSDPESDIPLGAREVTRVGEQMARVWAAALPHLRVAAVRAWLSTLDDDERERETRNALALAEWLIAYSKEARQPRFTPGQLAATRRTSGETVDVIFNTLFADGGMLEAMLGKDGAA
jgi:transcriptional regulator with XRE-family HTH domain